MNNYSLNLEQVSKIYGRRLIFKNINFRFECGRIYGLAGQNGSGKSTLAKIICGLISPTSGKVIHSNGSQISPEMLHNHIGFVSPYLVLYDEFSAEENLMHISRIRGLEFDAERAEFLFNEFNIYDRRTDLLKAYSSGMKQRVKFIFALMHNPDLLLLDEPTSNLDNAGKEKVYEIISREKKEHLIIVASNEDSDLNLCEEVIQIEDYKNI